MRRCCRRAGAASTRTATAAIDSTEGVNAAAPRTIIGSRDGLRQTVVDLMQLVRQVEVGIDVDGDGTADLDAQRIYYAGQSFGGIYGTILLGVEPSIKAGVPNVPGGSITEVARLGGFRVSDRSGAGHAAAAAAEPAASAGSARAVATCVSTRTCRCATCRRWSTPCRARSRSPRCWIATSGCSSRATRCRYAAAIRKELAGGLCGQAGDLSVRQGRPDRAEPDHQCDPARRRPGRPRDLLPQRSGRMRPNPAVGKNPHTFLTNIGNAAAAAYRSGRAAADRRVLRQPRCPDH